MKKILITSLTLFIFGITVAQTVTLHPTQEGMVDNLIPATNIPNYPDFLANAWTASGAPFVERSLMQFDFSSIPNNATIISAQLSLYGHPSNDNTQLSLPLSGSNACTLQRVTVAWNPNTVTWNNQPPTSTTDEAALAESTSPMEDYLNIDIKNMVVDMINNGNYGLEILLDTEVLYRCLLFATMANSDSTVFPTLVINYTTDTITCTAIYPVQEGMVDNLNPTTNIPNYPDFLANAWTASGAPFVERSLMQFDFSSIPNNATIISAQLSLYGHPSDSNTQLSDPLSGSNASTLRRVTSSWNQNTVTWNNQPITTATNEVALAQSTSSMEDYLNIDIKNMVVNMINNGNYGLEMLLDTEAIYRCLLFATTANSDSSVFPRLNICYAISVAPPPVASFQSSNTIFCADNCVNFIDHSTNATSWHWSFAGATPSSSTEENPFVCYTTAGNYSVTLIASNAAGSDTVTFNNYINVISAPPTPVITQHDDTLFCSIDPTYTSYQWYSDSTLITGATDTFLIVSKSGNYNVQVANGNGCKIAAGINVIIGLQNYVIDNIISLSPNPASNQLTIHISSSANWQKSTISIMNVLSQEVSTSTALIRGEDAIVDISKLSAGMYFLQLKSESGNAVKRFVKE